MGTSVQQAIFFSFPRSYTISVIDPGNFADVINTGLDMIFQSIAALDRTSNTQDIGKQA